MAWEWVAPYFDVLSTVNALTATVLTTTTSHRGQRHVASPPPEFDSQRDASVKIDLYGSTATRALYWESNSRVGEVFKAHAREFVANGGFTETEALREKLITSAQQLTQVMSHDLSRSIAG